MESLIINSSSLPEKQQTIRLLEQNLQEKEKMTNDELEENCLTLLRLYEDQDQDNTDPSLVEKKGNIFHELGCLYDKKKDYAESEKYFLKSIIESSKDSPKEFIQRHWKLINVLDKQEKYQEAKKYCLTILELLKKHVRIEGLVTVYSNLIAIGYKLKEENTVIDSYYQYAKKYLEQLKNRPELYQKLSKTIEKRWWTIKSCVIEQHISSDNELKNNIEELKNRSECSIEQHQSVKEQLGEIKELIRKVLNNG